MLNKFDLPPIWLAIHILAVVIVSHLLPWPSIDGAIINFIGMASILAGLLVIVQSVRELRAHGTTIHPHHKSKAVCDTGPFKFSRHPIYLGMVLILTGVVVISGAAVGVLFVVSFYFLVDRRFARPEEAKMRQLLPDYENYAAKTRRWLQCNKSTAIAN